MPKEMKMCDGEEERVTRFIIWALRDRVGQVCDAKPEDQEKHVVTMQVNGVEVDPKETIRRILACFDEEVEAAARGMVEDRGCAVVGLLHTALGAFEASIDEGILKMFPEREREG